MDKFANVYAAAVHFTRLDNRADVFVENANGTSEAWSKTIHNDPPLDLNAPILHNLTLGKNTVIVRIFNAPGAGNNPWHAAFKTSVNSSVIQDIDESGPNGPAGLVKEYSVSFSVESLDP